jgi:hypothetical protein
MICTAEFEHGCHILKNNGTNIFNRSRDIDSIINFSIEEISIFLVEKRLRSSILFLRNMR